jgi:hypothetical protein
MEMWGKGKRKKQDRKERERIGGMIMRKNSEVKQNKTNSTENHQCVLLLVSEFSRCVCVCVCVCVVFLICNQAGQTR